MSEIFSRKGKNKAFINVSAPMVRYSKATFRMLVQNHGVDLSFSPMILADSFVASEKARSIDFPIVLDENKSNLIVQFATNNADNFATALQMVKPYCAGVDLNCGCPQRWAREEGLGAALLQKPELVAEIIRKGVLASSSAMSISAKIRIVNEDTRATVEFARRLEKMGASWITLHGRNVKATSNSPVHLDVIKKVKDSLQIPLIGNGGVSSFQEAQQMFDMTGVDGVMSAQGLLENPALFTNQPCSWPVVQEFIDLSLSYPGVTNSAILVHHLHLMTEKLLLPWEKKLFHALSSASATLDFLRERNYIFQESSL
jgi:tRNA-dihydrouridine synthase 4